MLSKKVGGTTWWVTVGVDSSGILRVLVHTFRQIDPDLCEIRIISARKATGREERQYGEGIG
ncbi:MAG: BrnT family toxin [Anaerolineae bacterium]|nr:BrnT family toxin [Anaerolineae bacterium]